MSLSGRRSWLFWIIPLLLIGLVAYFVVRPESRPNLPLILAARELPAAERVEKLKEAKAEYAPVDVVANSDQLATLKGTIHGSDGKPLTGKILGSAQSMAGNGSYGKGIGALKESFSVEVHPGLVWLSLQPDDYAPKLAGPFDARSGATVEGIDVVLEPGFPARVRVVDEHGKPVAGAHVSGGLTIDQGDSVYYQVNNQATDVDGVLTIAHAATGLYGISAEAPGFQHAESVKTKLSPDALTTLTLIHAHAVSGVVAGPDGQPVAGARIRRLASFRPSMTNNHGISEPPIATTDKDGHFRIDTFNDGETFALLVESDRLGRRVVRGVKAGQDDLTWNLGPDLTLSGTILGDLIVLEKERGKPVVEITQRGVEDSIDNSTWRPRITTTVPVERTERGGRFKVTGVLPGEVIVAAAGHVVTLDVGVETPDNPVAIDLNETLPHPSTRRVVVRLTTPDGAAAPTGSIVAYATDTNIEHYVRSLVLPIQRGEVSFEMLAPGRVSYSSRAVVGYWFNDSGFEVPGGEWPLVVEVKTLSAGAIVGRVFEADGTTPAVSGVTLGCHVVEKSKAMKNDEFLQVNNVPVDAEGRFFMGPLPIGGTYIAVAGRGHNRQVSKPVRLDGSKATERVELRLTKSVVAGGRVVGPDGSPLAGVLVQLTLRHPEAGTSWAPPSLTDFAGRFRFDDLSATVGQYVAELNLHKDYLPVEATLDRSGRDLEIQLQRGQVIKGRVVDAETGRPIPGVEIYAARTPWQAGVRFAYEAEAKTDRLGQFRFSNLAPGSFELNDRNGLTWKSPTSREVEADQAEPVEIRASLPAWSTLKPVP